MFGQKGKIILITAIVGALLAGYALFAYWYIVPRAGNSESNNNPADKPAVSTTLNPSKIRMDVRDGNLSTDKKMFLTLKFSGLENADVIDELRRDGNLLIEIDQKSATIRSTEILGEDALLVNTETNIDDERFKEFNNGKMQNLEVRADMNYGAGNTVSKMLSTKFQKSDKKSASGQEIVFNENKTVDVKDENSLASNPKAETIAPKTPSNNLKKLAETQLRKRQIRMPKRIINDEYDSEEYDSEDEMPVTNKVKEGGKSIKKKIDK